MTDGPPSADDAPTDAVAVAAAAAASAEMCFGIQHHWSSSLRSSASISSRWVRSVRALADALMPALMPALSD